MSMAVMKDRRTPLECGAAIINMFRGQKLSWKQMMSEWLDNSFGANATRVTFRVKKGILEIIDNGDGVEDLKAMESPAKSRKSVGNKASMYGVGGVMSQIHASDAGVVEVHTRRATSKGRIEIDWGACIRQDQIFAVGPEESSALPTSKTGTTISFALAKRIKDVDRLARDLGYRYTGLLRAGSSITIEVEDKVYKVKPYEHPPFSREVSFDFELNGQRITGFCGIVKKGEPNPFPGWSVHWAYRFIDAFGEPAEGKPFNRVYAEVHLPETWSNIGPTKDSFTFDPEELWSILAEKCRAVVDEADNEAQEIELTTSTRAAEDILAQALGGKKGIKGARPGDAGRNGTVESTGDGGKHRNFTTSQPGEKTDADGSLPARTPDRVRIAWDDTIEGLYQIQASGARGRTFILTLNSAVPQVAEFKGYPSLLATYCLGFVAREISEGRDHVQKLFPAFRDAEFKDVYRHLLERIAGASSPGIQE